MRLLGPAFALAAVMAAGGQAQTVSDMADIAFWVGSGTNQSALVLDFQDGYERKAFVWGYRYNDPPPSGAKMLLDIDAADPRLSVVSFGSAEANLFISEIIYLDGSVLHARQTGDFQTDLRYWGYFIAGGTAFDLTEGQLSLDATGPPGATALPPTWLESPCGASDESFGSPGRFLGGLSWDAWVFGEYGVLPAGPVYAAAAPDPPRPTASLRLSGNQAVVSVASESGFVYQLGFSGSPDGAWTNQAPVLAGNGDVLDFTNSIPGSTPARFFRITVTR